MSIYRFRGVAPFANSDLYFGRDEDVERLYNAMITRSLTVLASPSGSGKTSLINAGITPKLESKVENSNVIKIRFNHFSGNEAYTPLDNLIQTINQHCQERQFTINETFTSLSLKEESVYYTLKKFRTSSQGFFILIDQFEELFSYPKEDQFRFAKAIEEVINRKAPLRYRLLYERFIHSDSTEITSGDLENMIFECDLHVLFSLRSDKLDGLSKLSRHFPQVFSSIVNLADLGFNAAKEIITNTSKVLGYFESPPFRFREKTLNRVLNYLTANNNSNVDLTQLQIVCRSIEISLSEYPKDVLVTVDDYNLPDLQDVIVNFYSKILALIPIEKRKIVRNFIVNNLIQNSQRISVDELTCLKLVDSHSLKLLLDERLLTTHNNRFGRVSYEISHDTLIAPILKYESETYRERVIQELSQSVLNLEESRKVEYQERIKAEQNLKNSIKLLSSLVPNGTLRLWEYFFIEGQRLVMMSKYKEAAEKFLYSKLSYDLPEAKNVEIDKIIENCQSASRLNNEAIELFRNYRYAQARSKYEGILSIFKSSIITQRIWHCDNPTMNEEYFAKIKGGEFTLGNNKYLDNNSNSIVLSDFQFGRFQVSNAQFSEFLNIYGYDQIVQGEFEGKNIIAPEWFGISKIDNIWRPSSREFSNHPIIRVTWYGAREFCRFWRGDLPSEAQWEYVSREGGGDILYSWGNERPSIENIKELGHIAIPELHKKSAETTSFEKGYDDGYVTPVAVNSYIPNVFGLHNLTGNVWEWCIDAYSEDSYDSFNKRIDPVNLDSDQLRRVIRGGSCYTLPHRCNNFFRNYGSAGDRYYYTGFRIAK